MLFWWLMAFWGQPGLASSSLYSSSPVTLILSILTSKLFVPTIPLSTPGCTLSTYVDHQSFAPRGFEAKVLWARCPFVTQPKPSKHEDISDKNTCIGRYRDCLWNRLDTWESEQSEWLETAKVLRHHQGKLALMTSSCNSSGVMPTKKRKVDLEAEAAGNGA